MTSDPGAQLPGPPRADFALPNVLDIQYRLTRFEAPRLRNFRSALPDSNDAVEFIVETDGPIPGRALGPVLYIGDTPVIEATALGPTTYRFVALTRQDLELDAPISLGWTGQRRTAQRTRFRYQP